LVALSGFVVAAVGTNLLQAATVRLGIDTLIANILGDVFACVLKHNITLAIRLVVLYVHIA